MNDPATDPATAHLSQVVARLDLPTKVALLTGADFWTTTPIQAIGDREGQVVVQVYAERADSAVDRPARWLVGFGAARVAAGESDSVPVTFGPRAFQHWTDDGWETEAGTFTLHAGLDVSDTPLTAEVTL